MELSTYFRINAKATGQFERTLIIADENSYVSYLEGCTAPIRDENQLHAAVVELVALDGFDDFTPSQLRLVLALARRVPHLVVGLNHDPDPDLEDLFHLSAATVEHVKSGKLRVLGVLDPKRLETLPEVPSVKEFGYEVEAFAWYALFAPAGTPDDVVAKLNAAFNAVLNRPDMVARARLNGIEIKTGNPTDLAKFVNTEYQRWTPIIEDLHLPKQ